LEDLHHTRFTGSALIPTRIGAITIGHDAEPTVDENCLLPCRPSELV
jgi:hypothetical protein